MREFPVQHRAHAVGSDDEIAVAEIAMHQRHLHRWTGISVPHPAQRHFETLPRPALATRHNQAARDAGSRRCCRWDGRYRTTRFPGWRRRRVLPRQPHRSRPGTTRRRSVRAFAPSFALELRRPLLKERGNALLEIFRRTRNPLRLEFEVELILERIVRAIPI